MLLDWRRPARLASLAAIAIFALLLVTPAAHAAATSITTDGLITGTVNLNADNDTVVVANVGGLLSHGLTPASSPTVCSGCNSEFDWSTAVPGDQTLAAGLLALIVLNGGEGADTLTAPQGATEVLKATLDGEGGNDLLTGSQAGDDLRGGTGDDRL